MKKKQLNNVKFSSHAIQRMFERDIPKTDVIKAIEEGEVINSYPDDKPYPSYLSLIFIGDRPLHIVFAENMDEKEIIIITLYIPDTEIWTDDFKSRRK